MSKFPSPKDGRALCLCCGRRADVFSEIRHTTWCIFWGTFRKSKGKE